MIDDNFLHYKYLCFDNLLRLVVVINDLHFLSVLNSFFVPWSYLLFYDVFEETSPFSFYASNNKLFSFNCCLFKNPFFFFPCDYTSFWNVLLSYIFWLDVTPMFWRVSFSLYSSREFLMANITEWLFSSKAFCTVEKMLPFHYTVR